VIRLFHENTNQWLHSHLHTAPLSHEQEVSCYGSEDGGDTGDNWELITANDYWQRDAKIRYFFLFLSFFFLFSFFFLSFSFFLTVFPNRLKHVDTGKFLNANGNIKYGNPIPGQLEISAVSRRSPDNVWTVMVLSFFLSFVLFFSFIPSCSIFKQMGIDKCHFFFSENISFFRRGSTGRPSYPLVQTTTKTNCKSFIPSFPSLLDFSVSFKIFFLLDSFRVFGKL